MYSLNVFIHTGFYKTAYQQNMSGKARNRGWEKPSVVRAEECLVVSPAKHVMEHKCHLCFGNATSYKKHYIS